MLPYQETTVLVNLLIQKCATTSSVAIARQLHARILTSIPTFAKTPFVYNNIISMYSRCGSFQDCRLVFDKMPHRNLISYNSIINACSRSTRNAYLAFDLLECMQNEDLTPKASTFTSLLQASSTLGNQLLGSLVQAQCIKCGVLDDVCVHTALLGVYFSCGNLDSAKKVFRLMEIKDDMAWDFMIFGSIKNGVVLEGLKIFSGMRKNHACPNQFTFAMVLNGCSKLEDSRIGQIVHAQLIMSGTFVDLRLNNALLDMYCSCGLKETAYEVFRRIDDPDLVSWNTMLSGYAANEDGEEAISMFVQLGRVSSAKPDEYTLAAVISATKSFPASDYGKPLHARIEKAGLQGSVHVSSSVISMYFRHDETHSAEKIFRSIIVKDVVLWTDMIAGHCRTNNMESAIRLFSNMLQNGHKTDSFVLSSVLSACAELVTLRQGEVIHSMAIKAGFAAEMTVCGSLIDMYAKSGELQAAESIFSTVTRPDLRCCNSMLGGYGHHGKSKEAFRVYDEISRNSLSPDQVTFLSLFATCSHRGLVDEGKLFWSNCLESWRTLPATASPKENSDSIQAAKQILSIDAEDSAANVLLTNLYAATGRWDGVVDIRRKLRGFSSLKDPGLSWIEVMKNIHVFSSGDQLHSDVDEVKAELHRLIGNLTLLEVEELT
ncbi:hypothetical protein Leryth_013655 [Lithospermum erythrorhizon]|nr:hypothetical protein Leryth_013655 [Lithospermum erythrorhizon]